METSGEPDTTSQTGRQMNCYKERQMNWRHPESRTSPARLETNESLYGETNELETSGEPDTTSQTGRQMNCYTGRQMNWRHPREPDTTSQTGRQMNCYKGKQMNWRHAGEPDTTSQTGRQMNRYTRRQMNWRHAEEPDTTSQTGETK